MEYTSYDRLVKILELAKGDAACAACMEDVANVEHILELYLENRPKEESMACSALPAALRIYYGRLLELVCRAMRFIDE